MTTLNIIVLLAAGIVLAVTLTLVFHKEYEDGLIGRFALGLIGLAAFSRIVGILEADFGYTVSPQGAMVWIGMALFLGRHLYRFLKHQSDGSFEWRPAKK